MRKEKRMFNYVVLGLLAVVIVVGVLIYADII
jgi:hypothetical protein